MRKVAYSKSKKFINKSNAEKKKLFFRNISKKILSKTYSGSAIIFITLASIGKAQTKIFLKPSYYVDDPVNFLGDIHLFKQQQLEKDNIRQAIKRLRDYGLITQNHDIFSLTLSGKKLAKKILGYKQKLEEEWDGKYRVVIFDIPETKRHHRDWLRGELYFLDYIKLQQSVFISKHSLTEDLVKEIKRRNIDDGVNYLLVEYVYDLKNQISLSVNKDAS